MVAHATAMVAKDANAMSLVNHDRAVILVLELNNLRQIGEVALHREHAVDNDELHSLLWQTLEQVLKVFHVVVLIVELTGERQASAVNDAGMVAVVADDIVATAHHHGKHSSVYRESGREAEGVVFVHKLGKLFLQLHMQVERSVEEAASCATRTIFVKRSLCCVYHALVSCESSVSV